jgi:hypothetical protein
LSFGDNAIVADRRDDHRGAARVEVRIQVPPNSSAPDSGSRERYAGLEAPGCGTRRRLKKSAE